jgi:predicted Zn-dependent protease
MRFGIFMKKITLLSLLLCLVTACAVSPTGRQQFAMMSPQQMDTMGAEAFTELKNKKPIADNRQVNRYVQCVAQAITSTLDNRESHWEVVVFDDDTPNAFALPGGKIGVHTGLLDVANNQHQLAAVIGHEIGHVLANHGNERMSQQTAVQGGIAIAGSIYDGGSGVLSQEYLMKALGLGAQVGILLPFSRVHESEADVIGLDLMAQAGFDPRESVSLWQNMAQASQGQSLEFLSTHPSHGTRIQDLQANMGRAMTTYEAAHAQGKTPNCG